ncbi:hypothetical protein FRB94_004950 [Tulasnella sp. JGI-2019a]|nr:hypothetical protein FRB94_004950 [Tulasnella sp. JGI-2019a]
MPKLEERACKHTPPSPPTRAAHASTIIERIPTLTCHCLCHTSVHHLSQTKCNSKVPPAGEMGGKYQYEERFIPAGAVTAEVTTHSKQLLHACRGGAVAIGLDKAGRELWSAVLEGKLAGSSTGPFYPNKITKEVFVTIDSAVAPLTTRVDLHYEFEWSTLHERGRQWHEIIQRARSAQNKERDSL